MSNDFQAGVAAINVEKTAIIIQDIIRRLAHQVTTDRVISTIAEQAGIRIDATKPLNISAIQQRITTAHAKDTPALGQLFGVKVTAGKHSQILRDGLTADLITHAATMQTVEQPGSNLLPDVVAINVDEIQLHDPTVTQHVDFAAFADHSNRFHGQAAVPVAKIVNDGTTTYHPMTPEADIVCAMARHNTWTTLPVIVYYGLSDEQLEATKFAKSFGRTNEHPKAFAELLHLARNKLTSDKEVATMASVSISTVGRYRTLWKIVPQPTWRYAGKSGLPLNQLQAICTAIQIPSIFSDDQVNYQVQVQALLARTIITNRYSGSNATGLIQLVQGFFSRQETLEEIQSVITAYVKRINQEARQKKQQGSQPPWKRMLKNSGSLLTDLKLLDEKTFTRNVPKQTGPIMSDLQELQREIERVLALATVDVSSEATS